MKKLLFISLIFFISHLSIGQSFEGVLTYSVDFELSGKFATMKDKIFEKMEKDGEFYDTIKIYIKGDKYLKRDNKIKPTSIIYSSEKNEIYSIQKDFEYVTIIDAEKFNPLDLDFKSPNISKIDSIKYISEIPCDILKLSWPNLGEEWYFYNDQIAKIDAKLFKNHNYEYLNLILEKTGSYPLEIVKSINQLISIRMSLTSIEEKKLSEEVFLIPELEDAEKDYAEIIRRTTGNEVMKIKN